MKKKRKNRNILAPPEKEEIRREEGIKPRLNLGI